MRETLAGALIYKVEDGWLCALCSEKNFVYKYAMHVWIEHEGIECIGIDWEDPRRTCIRIKQRVLR